MQHILGKQRIEPVGYSAAHHSLIETCPGCLYESLCAQNKRVLVF